MTSRRAESVLVSTGDAGPVGGISRKEAGEVIHNRRVAAGIKSVNQFAEKSGIHRDTQEGREGHGLGRHL